MLLTSIKTGRWPVSQAASLGQPATVDQAGDSGFGGTEGLAELAGALLRGGIATTFHPTIANVSFRACSAQETDRARHPPSPRSAPRPRRRRSASSRGRGCRATRSARAARPRRPTTTTTRATPARRDDRQHASAALPRRAAAVALLDGVGAHVRVPVPARYAGFQAIRNPEGARALVHRPDTLPVPTSGVDADLVTPGVWGFVVTFLLVVAVVLLIIDMTRRIRRVTHRAQVREALAAERPATAAEGEAPAADSPKKPSVATARSDPSR